MSRTGASYTDRATAAALALLQQGLLLAQPVDRCVSCGDSCASSYGASSRWSRWPRWSQWRRLCRRRGWSRWFELRLLPTYPVLAPGPTRFRAGKAPFDARHFRSFHPPLFSSPVRQARPLSAERRLNMQALPRLLQWVKRSSAAPWSAVDNGRRARFEHPACRNTVATIALTMGLTVASCAAG
jgi:hypothetical protein